MNLGGEERDIGLSLTFARQVDVFKMIHSEKSNRICVE